LELQVVFMQGELEGISEFLFRVLLLELAEALGVEITAEAVELGALAL
jgi:inner membrane protein involved in colicin E2 resistance